MFHTRVDRAFRAAVRFIDIAREHEAVAVLRQRVHRMREKRADIVAIPSEPRVWIRRTPMHRFASAFAVEIDALIVTLSRRSSSRSWRVIIRAVVGIDVRFALVRDSLEALDRRMVLGERAVDGEISVTCRPSVDRLRHHFLEEVSRESALRKPLAIARDNPKNNIVVGRHVKTT